MTYKRNILLMAVATALVMTSMAVQAGHDARDGDYFTAGAYGDYAANCSVKGVIFTVAGTAGIPLEEDPDPTGTDFSFEDELGWCIGGYSFGDLDADGSNFGNWIISVDDDNSLGGPSGAHRSHFPDGEVHEDNFDTCYDVPRSSEVPDDGVLTVWIDGLVWWALGQPCGEGQSGQGTLGTITLEHA